MLEQLLSSDTTIKVFEYCSALLKNFNIDISELNNIKLIALALILSALFIFVCLIVVIIFYNFIRLFRPSSPQSSASSTTYQIFTLDEQEELELELQKELDLALAQRNDLEKQKEQEQQMITSKKKPANSPDDSKEINKNINKFELKNLKNKKKELNIPLDWQKQKIPHQPAEIPPAVSPDMLSYKPLSSHPRYLIGLLMDMLERGIDRRAIAQTLNYKTQGLCDENDIIKLIDSVEYFIKLCQSDIFYKLDNYDQLPKVELALYHLANNDVSLALVLLESLMDKRIDKIATVSSGKKQQIFAEISNYACCMGTLAETNDIMFATSIYEMAVELNSNNPTAWSRLGDVYQTANNESRAIWAYKNAYSFADSEINAADMANASAKMSVYLHNKGNSLQAAKMHNIAKQYYDSIGINNPFTNQDLEALKIIEQNHQHNLPQMIDKLLQKNR